MASPEHRWTKVTSAENAFWQSVRSDAPWPMPADVRPSAGSPGAAAAAGVFVYLLDVQSGWMQAGTFAEVEMEAARIRAVADKRDERVFALVGSLAKAAAAADSPAAAPLVVEGLRLALEALTVTRTFPHVIRDRGSLEGHWFVFIYTAHDGAVMTHEAYASSPRPGPLVQEEIDHMVGHSLRLHLRPATTVGHRMRAGGGAVVCPRFKKLTGD